MLTSLQDLEPGTWQLLEAMPSGMRLTPAHDGGGVTHLAVRAPTGDGTVVPIIPASLGRVQKSFCRLEASGRLVEGTEIARATHVAVGTLMDGGIMIPKWAHDFASPICVWMWDQQAEAPTVFPAIRLQAATSQTLVVKVEQGKLQVVGPNDYDFTESQLAPAGEDLRLTPDR